MATITHKLDIPTADQLIVSAEVAFDNMATMDREAQQQPLGSKLAAAAQRLGSKVAGKVGVGSVPMASKRMV